MTSAKTGSSPRLAPHCSNHLLGLYCGSRPQETHCSRGLMGKDAVSFTVAPECVCLGAFGEKKVLKVETESLSQHLAKF